MSRSQQKDSDDIDDSVTTRVSARIAILKKRKLQQTQSTSELAKSLASKIRKKYKRNNANNNNNNNINNNINSRNNNNTNNNDNNNTNNKEERFSFEYSTNDNTDDDQNNNGNINENDDLKCDKCKKQYIRKSAYITHINKNECKPPTTKQKRKPFVQNYNVNNWDIQTSHISHLDISEGSSCFNLQYDNKSYTFTVTNKIYFSRRTMETVANCKGKIELEWNDKRFADDDNKLGTQQCYFLVDTDDIIHSFSHFDWVYKSKQYKQSKFNQNIKNINTVSLDITDSQTNIHAKDLKHISGLNDLSKRIYESMNGMNNLETLQKLCDYSQIVSAMKDPKAFYNPEKILEIIKFVKNIGNNDNSPQTAVSSNTKSNENNCENDKNDENDKKDPKDKKDAFLEADQMYCPVDTCLKILKKSSVKGHLKTFHTSLLKYECAICKHKFLTKEILDRHTKHSHGKKIDLNPPQPCQKCQISGRGNNLLQKQAIFRDQIKDGKKTRNTLWKQYKLPNDVEKFYSVLCSMHGKGCNFKRKWITDEHTYT